MDYLFGGDCVVLDKEATGSRIRELRKQRRLKVMDISDFMGFFEPQAVYKWERGESLPTPENLLKLSILFGVPVDSILRCTEEARQLAEELSGRTAGRGEDKELSSPLPRYEELGLGRRAA